MSSASARAERPPRPRNSCIASVTANCSSATSHIHIQEGLDVLKLSPVTHGSGKTHSYTAHPLTLQMSNFKALHEDSLLLSQLYGKTRALHALQFVL